MTKQPSASERAAMLINEAVDVLLRAAQAPESPVATFASAKVRRELRRSAARLRAGKTEPRYVNLHSPEDLADIFERTAERDEIREQTAKDFQRIRLELARVCEENDPAVPARIEELVRDAKRAAEQQGSASEAAGRYRQLLFLGWYGGEWHSRRRRQRGLPAPSGFLAPDPSAQARLEASAAERLASPPPGETIVAIPPEGQGSGAERILLRIGTGKASWVGSFARGHQRLSTVVMMPDDKHLFVSAGGAGYVIEARSGTLVETIGMDVLRVICNEPRTLFVVDHGGVSLEAFGRTGRLWRTDRISAGGFRELALTGHAIVGEAWDGQRAAWVEFAVSLETGEVRFAR